MPSTQLKASDEAALKNIREDIAVFLYRSIREFLFNVVKHAGVKEARLELHREGRHVRAAVIDAGAGFHVSQMHKDDGFSAGFGLSTIRQRLELLGGRMEIESTPGQGSRIELVVPLEEVSSRDDQIFE